MKRRKFVLAYTIASVVLASFLTVSAVNYLSFFPALDSVKISVVNQELVRDQGQNVTKVLTSFQIENPSQYSGFRISWASLHLYFSSGNESLFATRSTERYTSPTIAAPGTPLGAGRTVTLNATFEILPQDSTALTSFLNKHGSNVNLHYTIAIRLVTFVEALVSTDILREIQKPLG